MLAFTLRPETTDDTPLHRSIYDSTREDELNHAGFPHEQREAFLDMQFRAQWTHYRNYFPDAEWSIIECDGRSAGRLILDRAEHEHHVLDLALLPAFRNRGIGTALLKRICAEAGALPVRLYALNADRAIRLYLRLGFRAVGDDGLNTELIWRRDEQGAPDTAAASQP